MSRIAGVIVGKRDQKGLFGRRKYFVKIRYSNDRFPLPRDLFEYKVSPDLYRITVQGSQVSGELAPIGKTYKYGASLQLLFRGRPAVA